MLTWGLISGLMVFVQTPLQFYFMRFLLGVAEAGFYPGVLLYLSQWFPAAHLCRAVSRFYIANPISWMMMGTLAGLLMGMDGLLGMAGWQWMLLIEAIPALVIAALLLLFLPDKPATATWLSVDEKAWLADHHAADLAASGAKHHDFWRTLFNPVVLGTGFVLALVFMCANALSFSTPKLLMQATGWSLVTVGFVGALVQVPTMIAMLVVCWHSDYRRQPQLHIAAMIALAAAGALGLAIAFNAGPGQAVAGVLASICLFTATSTVVGTLATPTASAILHPSSRAVGFAAINTIAQVGNFLGPVVWGYAANGTGSFQLGLNSIPLILLLPLALILKMRRNMNPRSAGIAAPATS